MSSNRLIAYTDQGRPAEEYLSSMCEIAGRLSWRPPWRLLLHLRGERRALRGEDQPQELRGLGLAGVLRDLVRGAGLLAEPLARLLDALRALLGQLGPDGALDHVRQDEAGVLVRLADTSGRIRDVADGHFPALEVDGGQIVFEHLVRVR